MERKSSTTDGQRPQGGLSIQALRRLILTALIVSVTVSSVGVFVLVEQIFNNFGPAVEKDLEWMTVRGARELSASSALGLAVADAQTTKERWTDHMNSKDVLSIVALGATGEVVATHGKPPLPAQEMFKSQPGAATRADKYVLSWSDSMVEGGSVGKVAVAVSTRRLSESKALLQKVRLTTGGSALLALIGGVVFVTFFTRAIIRRDAQLAEYAANLEKKVEARTAELDERNRGMRLVLDNVSQGFVTVSITGVMAPERSAVVDTWLGVPKDGELFDAYIRRLDPKGADWFVQGLTQIQEDFMPLELLLDQMPKRLETGKETLQVAYIPILRQDKVENILVVMTNITAELQRERSERQQKEMLSMFQAISSDRNGFVDFFTDANRLADAIGKNQAETFEIEKRLVHTLKGNASLYRLDSIVQVCHEVETRMTDEPTPLTESERQAIVGTWEGVRTSARGLLGDVSAAMVINDSDYAHLDSLLTTGAPRQTLQTALHSWKLEPVSLRFDRLATQVRQLATRLEKPDIKIHIESHGVRLDPKAWADFWSSFVHVARNAVDHGIESPASRTNAGKAAHGSLWLSSFVKGDTLVIVAKDDGKGIDWDRLGQKAAAKGLAHATRSDLEAALFADGVSTLDAASTISGRGVGMAAVKEEVLRKGGTISIQSELGKGTTFEFRFPHAGAFSQEAAA
jgi:HPt (histidine-containing phosphotransfer) domain-containing protein